MQVPGLGWDALAGEALAWRETRTVGVRWLPLSEEGPGVGVDGDGTPGGTATVLVWMDAGCGYPPHRHLGPEDVLVLQGGYRDEMGEYGAGDHVHYAAGSTHSPCALGKRGDPACVLYATIQVGTEPFESA